MSNIHFTVDDLRGAVRHRAAFHSVFSPLFGNRFLAFDSETIQSAFDALYTEYRVRLYELKNAELARLRAKRALTFACNCPPFSVSTAYETKTCHLMGLCPFCWGRMVLDFFCYLEYLGYGTKKPRDDGGNFLKPLPGCDVVSFVTRWRFQNTRNMDWAAVLGIAAGIRGVQELPGLLRRRITARREAEYKAQHAIAGCINHCVDFPPNYGNGEVILERCGVLLVPTDRAITEATQRYRLAGYLGVSNPEKNMFVTNHGPLEKKSLLLACCDVFSYPVGMLRHPEKSHVVAVLNGLHMRPKVRKSVVYGPKSRADFARILGLDFARHGITQEDEKHGGRRQRR